LSVIVCEMVVDVEALSAALAVRGGGIWTSAAVTPSTTAVTASSAITILRSRPGPVSAVRLRTSRRENAAMPITTAASPILTRISRPYVLS
jgi:hypothetical protein